MKCFGACVATTFKFILSLYYTIPLGTCKEGRGLLEQGVTYDLNVDKNSNPAVTWTLLS